jgi:hypothetical protein
MEITFGNMKVKLNIFKAFQHPSDINECFLLDIVSILASFCVWTK